MNHIIGSDRVSYKMVSQQYIYGIFLLSISFTVYDVASQLDEAPPTTYRPPLPFLNVSKRIPLEGSSSQKLDTETSRPILYDNDTIVNYVTARPKNDQAEEVYVTVVPPDDDVIYVTTDNSLIDGGTESEDDAESLPEDLSTDNVIARRFGFAAGEPERLNTRLANNEGDPATHDAWKPVWPHTELPTAISPTLPVSYVPTDVRRYPIDRAQNGRFPVSKEPITAYFFDLSHSLLPTGGPLFDPSVVTSESSRPTGTIEDPASEVPYVPTISTPPSLRSTPVLSKVITAQPLPSLTLDSVKDQSADAVQELSVTVTPTVIARPSLSLADRFNAGLRPVAVDQISGIAPSSIPSLEPSMADSSTGEVSIESTNSLISTPTLDIKSSTTPSVNSVAVDSRTPLWVRLSQKRTSSSLPTSTIVDKTMSSKHVPVSFSSDVQKSTTSNDVQSSPTVSPVLATSIASNTTPFVSISLTTDVNIASAVNTDTPQPTRSHIPETITPVNMIPSSEEVSTHTLDSTVPDPSETLRTSSMPTISPVENPPVETFSLSDAVASISSVSMPPSSIVVDDTSVPGVNTPSSMLESSLSDSTLTIGTTTSSPTTTLPPMTTHEEMEEEIATTDTSVGEDLLPEPLDDNDSSDTNETLSKIPEQTSDKDSISTFSASPTALPDLISGIFPQDTTISTTVDTNVKLSYDLFTPTYTVATPRIKETIELIEKSTPVPSSSPEPPTVNPADIQTVTDPNLKSASPPYMQTDSRQVQTVLKPATDNGQPELHIVETHANGTNTTQISPYVKAAVSYDPIEFCKHRSNIRSLLGEWVNKHLQNGTTTPKYEVKIFSQPNCSSLKSSSSRDEDLFTESTDLYFYVVDKGHMDPNVTLLYPRNPTRLEISKELEYLKAKILHLELVSALSSGEDLMLEKEAVGTSIVAITISLVLLSVFLIAGILAFVIIRKRRAADQANGRRCTPAANDAYSMDSVSMYYHSFKRKSKKRASNKSIKSYLNQGFDDPNGPSRPLNFAKLTHFITDVDSIYEEFTNIPSVSPNYDEVPRGVEDKNRYANVIPLTETRVTLKGNARSPQDEYINANYVHGARNEPKYYIATQAPLDETVEDFWKMIWEQESKVVVMLTDFVEKGIDKCADYLPPSETLDCHRVYGEFQVTLKTRDMREKYVVSHVQLKNLENNLVREVVHMWYTGWPHTGTPKEEKTFISFIFETRAIRKKLRSKGPIVVHCSPGTGRTGTFIACDVSMRHFDDHKSVDIPKTVFKIRRERSGAIQTKEQYSYIYRVTNLYAAKLMTGNLDLF